MPAQKLISKVILSKWMSCVFMPKLLKELLLELDQISPLIFRWEVIRQQQLQLVPHSLPIQVHPRWVELLPNLALLALQLI
ncbi:MAG: hypothetical protein BTM33_06195 [Synechococcus sp. Lanier]|nr:MAG: hypothetical protein BTM33_06195 [Synechococcus sp. Lanier]